MYLKLFLSSTLSLLTLPFPASAQIKPGPSQVVCVVDANESPADLSREPGWKDPNIQGFLIRQSWASLEPTEGSFDFRLFDQAVQLAQQNGKFVGLDLGAGSFSPKWIYSAGARAFDVSKTTGETQIVPLPWDPIFMSAWGSMIEALGNRYDTNPAVAYVVMSGVGRGYDSSLAASEADVPKFTDMDGQVFWSHAANDIADFYTTSFPHTRIVFPMTGVEPGPDGEKLVEAVASQQLESHPGQIGLDSGSLATQDFGQLSSMAPSGPAGLSSVGIRVDPSQDLPELLTSVQQSGLLQKTGYLEVDSHQVSNEDVQATLKQITSSLASTGQTGSSTGNTSTSSSTSGSTIASTSSSSEGTSTADDSSTDANTASTASSGSSSVTNKAVSAATAAADAANAAAITTAAWAAALGTHTIWLSPATNAGIGTGTQSDPLNVPTAADLDAALFTLSSHQVPNLVFHFLPGTYYTMGNCQRWVVSTGWQFLGAGQGISILKMDPSAMTYTGANKNADWKQVVSTNGVGNIVIKDMTIDANCTGFGSQLTSSFVMPAPRATVTVKVADSSAFHIGKWVYLQDSVPTGGLNLYYGLMEVTAIPSSTKVTLMNSEVPTAGTVTGSLTAGSPVIQNVSSIANLEESQVLNGPGIAPGSTILSATKNTVTINTNATATESNAKLTYSPFAVLGTCSTFCPRGNFQRGTVIPATVHVLTAGCINGITAGRNNDVIEDVTVQNVGRAFYEGPAGICLNGFGTTSVTLVKDCTVKDIWGVASWIISMTLTDKVTLTGNSITGNGFSQAFSFVANNSNTTMTNNTVVRCNAGVFSDTGTKTNCTISGNNFQTINGILLAGAQFAESSFTHNTIDIISPLGFGLGFEGVKLTDCTFSQNTIQVAPGVTDVQGILINANCVGSSGNIFSNNIIDSSAHNSSASSSFGTESGNTDANGNPLSLGLDQ